MGASNAVRVKSDKSEQQSQADEENQQNHHRPQMILPQFDIQDVENNNNHIFVNPQDRFLTLIDECDLLNNNNTTLLNNNYLAITLSPLTKANALTTTTSLFKLNKKSSLNRKTAVAAPEELQSVFANPHSNNKNCNNLTSEKKMQRESSEKSPKKQQITKENEKKNKKKKKEKPKAPRAPNAGGGGGGGGGKRGMSEKEQMSRRPKKKLEEK